MSAQKTRIEGNIKLLLQIGVREPIFIQAYGDELEIKLLVIHEFELTDRDVAS